MSYDLGHSRGYIYNISSGKSVPPLKELFAICEYFHITPKEFFDEEIENPVLIERLVEEGKKLDTDALESILGVMKNMEK